jgi:hypothetical protein
MTGLVKVPTPSGSVASLSHFLIEPLRTLCVPLFTVVQGRPELWAIPVIAKCAACGCVNRRKATWYVGKEMTSFHYSGKSSSARYNTAPGPSPVLPWKKLLRLQHKATMRSDARVKVMACNRGGGWTPWRQSQARTHTLFWLPGSVPCPCLRRRAGRRSGTRAAGPRARRTRPCTPTIRQQPWQAQRRPPGRCHWWRTRCSRALHMPSPATNNTTPLEVVCCGMSDRDCNLGNGHQHKDDEGRGAKG